MAEQALEIKQEAVLDAIHSHDLVTDKPVLVTGASGFVATYVIKLLLQKGYKVRGTVRSVKDAQTKYKYLYDLDQKGGLLELVEANLLSESSFDNHCNGLEYVIHIASPIVQSPKDPQKDLVDPAVKGTLSVLNAATKAGTVKRVVLTSSCAAITDEPKEGYLYTEADWNDQSTLDRNPYNYSKVLSERAAWKYMEELPADKKTFDLIAICPNMIIGPELSKPKAQALNGSNSVIYKIAMGKFPVIIKLGFCFVDVLNVADAHVLAMEKKDANGRYLVACETLLMRDVCTKTKEKYPKCKAPTFGLDGSFGSKLVGLFTLMEDKTTQQFIKYNLGRSFLFKNDKACSLGIKFRPVYDTIFELVDWLYANNYDK